MNPIQNTWIMYVLKNFYDDTFYACFHEQRDVVYLVDMGQICHFYEKKCNYIN